MKNIAVIIVIYKFPSIKIKKLKRSLIKIGVKSKDLYIEDNTRNNIGYAGAINSLLRRIGKSYDYFLILNPDIEIKNDFISPLIETLNNAKADIVGPIIYNERGGIWGSRGILDKKRYSAKMSTNSFKKLTYVDFVPGTAFMITKNVLKATGFFEEKYFLYYDEVDFCFRAKRQGFKLAINPRSIIIHAGSYSVGKNSDAMKYYLARSHLYFLEKFAPLSIKIREFTRLPKTIWQARKSPYELWGILDYFLRRTGRNSKILIKADKAV